MMVWSNFVEVAVSRRTCIGVRLGVRGFCGFGGVLLMMRLMVVQPCLRP